MNEKRCSILGTFYVQTTKMLNSSQSVLITSRSIVYEIINAAPIEIARMGYINTFSSRQMVNL